MVLNKFVIVNLIFYSYFSIFINLNFKKTICIILEIMLRKFAEGKIEKKILPGSNTQGIIPKLERAYSNAFEISSDYIGDDGRNYVNTGTEKYEDIVNSYKHVSNV